MSWALFRKRFAVFAFVTALMPAAGFAQDRVLQPVQSEGVLGRYVGGSVALTSRKAGGVVQVMPIGLDHDGLTFIVTVFNDGHRPSEINTQAIGVKVAEQPIRVFMREEVMAKERDRAERRQMLAGFTGAVLSAALAAQRDTYRSTVVTPRGTYRSTITAPSVSGQIGAQRATERAADRYVEIDQQLSLTLAALAQELFKRTTLDPGESYAGRLVTERVKSKKGKIAPVEVTVDWNGDRHIFWLQIAQYGIAAPHIEMVPQAPIVARKASWAD